MHLLLIILFDISLNNHFYQYRVSLYFLFTLVFTYRVAIVVLNLHLRFTHQRVLKVFPKLSPAPTELAESLEQLRALWHGHQIAVHRSDQASAAGVDTPEDLARVRALLESKVRK